MSKWPTTVAICLAQRFGVACSFATLLLLTIIGCGEEKQVVKDRAAVSGTVTFNGKPLPAGTLTFRAAKGPVAAGTSIREGGRYSMDRAPVGLNRVSVETDSLQYGYPAGYVKIPEKYGDSGTSGLTVEIKPGNNETINFDLK